MRRTVKKNRTTALFLAMTLVLSAAETGGLWQMEAMASQTGREEADEDHHRGGISGLRQKLCFRDLLQREDLYPGDRH